MDINVVFTKKNESPKCQTVTLEDLNPCSGQLSYVYNRVTQGGANGVATTNCWVLLSKVLGAAADELSITLDDYWDSGSTLEFYDAAGEYTAYEEINGTFNYDDLNDENEWLYFAGAMNAASTLFTGPVTPVCTVIALKTASATIPDDGESTAADVVADLTPGTAQAPRLLWGLPESVDDVDDPDNWPAIAGARLPQQITKIEVIAP